jgi:hypothetical protein
VLSGAETPVLTTNGGNGTWTFGNRKPINFSSIETLDTPPPTARADRYDGTAGAVLNVQAARGVLANDADPVALPLVAAVTRAPANGRLTLKPDGGFDYTPNSADVLSDSFSYAATNSVGIKSSSASVSLAFPPTGGGDNGGAGCDGICPPGPAETPELGSLLLLGSGLTSLGGYALLRRRASRARPEQD